MVSVSLEMRRLRGPFCGCSTEMWSTVTVARSPTERCAPMPEVKAPSVQAVEGIWSKAREAWFSGSLVIGLA